ncbi:MAG: hypothetical protein ACLFTB_09380 [Desulfovibrionales bacterium]
MTEITERLVQDIQNRGADPFSMAYELTKIYAGSEDSEAGDIPVLFLQLYEMFSTGAVSPKKAASKKKS